MGNVAGGQWVSFYIREIRKKIERNKVKEKQLIIDHLCFEKIVIDFVIVIVVFV